MPRIRGDLTARIHSLRQQHDAAEQMAAAILSIVESFRDEYDAIPIARLVGKLNALLRVHFAHEDTVLYPMILCSGDGEAAALGHRFALQTESLAPEFEEFSRRWSGPTAIHSMFELFSEEATALFAKLSARMSARTIYSTPWRNESPRRERPSRGFPARRRLRPPAPG